MAETFICLRQKTIEEAVAILNEMPGKFLSMYVAADPNNPQANTTQQIGRVVDWQMFPLATADRIVDVVVRVATH